MNMETIAEIFDILVQNIDLASAASAMTSAVVALFALVISTIAVGVSVWTLKQQRRHNILTVKPIPEITVADYDNSLRIKLRNHGSGPLIIKSLVATFQKSSFKSLIDCMPNLNERHWTNFSGVIEGRSLLPSREIVLLELTAEKGEINFNIPRDLARLALSETEIEIYYTDVYESKFDAYKKSLSWFGRNLE